MADALNDGVDLHSLLASEIRISGMANAEQIRADDSRSMEIMASITEEERAIAKEINFGLPVGMGFETLMDRLGFMDGTGIEETAFDLRRMYFITYPEMRVYLHDRGARNAGVLTLTGRLRALASYTQQRNTIFQGAAADGAKLALYRLFRKGYRVVAFIHDEMIIEVGANADLPACQRDIDSILIEAMREICPDVAIEVKGEFSRSWGKTPADRVDLGGGNAEMHQALEASGQPVVSMPPW
jgi:DNA polymerase I-like protein with 3'-5' exonuclease and polymerase domains